MRFRHPVSGTQKSVTQSVAVSLVEELKRLFGKVETLSTYTVGDITNKNFNIEEDSDEDIHPNIINVSYTESRSDFGIIVKDGNRVPYIVRDKEIAIKPVYTRTKLTVTFTFKSKSQTEVNDFVKRLEQFILDRRTSHKQTITYHYYINRSILKMLYIIFKYKEEQIAFGFKEYIESIMEDNLNLVFTQDGIPKELAMLEKQLNVTGYFRNIPKFSDIDKDKDRGEYIATFNYEIEFDKAEYVDVDYRYVVHNKLLPREVLVLKERQSIVDKRYIGEIAMQNGLLSTDWLYIAMESVANRGYVQIPRLDIESQIERIPSMLNLFSVLCLMDKEDDTRLFSLLDLGSVSISENVLSYMRDVREYMTTIDSTFFYLALYEDGELSDNEIYVDEEMTVRTRGPLNIENLYRVMVRVQPNISTHASEAREILLTYSAGDKAFFKETLNTEEKDWFENRGNLLSSGVIQNINLDLSYFENDKYAMLTVLTSYISVILKENR